MQHQYTTIVDTTRFDLEPRHLHQGWKEIFIGSVIKLIKGKIHTAYGYVKHVTVEPEIPRYVGSHLTGNMSVTTKLTMQVIKPRLDQLVSAYVVDVSALYIQATTESMMISVPLTDENSSTAIGDRIVIKIKEMTYENNKYLVTGDVVDISNVSQSYQVAEQGPIEFYKQEDMINDSPDLDYAATIIRLVERFTPKEMGSGSQTDIAKFYANQYALINSKYGSVLPKRKLNHTWYEFWEVLQTYDFPLEHINGIHLSPELEGAVQALLEHNQKQNPDDDSVHHLFDDGWSELEGTTVPEKTDPTTENISSVTGPAELITASALLDRDFEMIKTCLESQMEGGLMVLRVGGTITRLQHDMIRLLKSLYSDVYIHRPHVMSPTSDQKYLICVNFTASDQFDQIIETLEFLSTNVEQAEKVMVRKSRDVTFDIFNRNVYEKLNGALADVTELLNNKHLLKNKVDRIDRKQHNLNYATSWAKTYKLTPSDVVIDDQPIFTMPSKAPTASGTAKPTRSTRSATKPTRSTKKTIRRIET